MIGNLIGGYLGDKLGRKATTNIGILICLVFGYISAFAPCFTSFIIWRCITMSGVGLIQSNVSTILGEMFT
jgi:MFS family permease